MKLSKISICFILTFSLSGKAELKASNELLGILSQFFSQFHENLFEGYPHRDRGNTRFFLHSETPYCPANSFYIHFFDQDLEQRYSYSNCNGSIGNVRFIFSDVKHKLTKENFYLSNFSALKNVDNFTIEANFLGLKISRSTNVSKRNTRVFWNEHGSARFYEFRFYETPDIEKIIIQLRSEDSKITYQFKQTAVTYQGKVNFLYYLDDRPMSPNEYIGTLIQLFKKLEGRVLTERNQLRILR